MNRALCKNRRGVGSSLSQAARVRVELAVLRLFVFEG